MLNLILIIVGFVGGVVAGSLLPNIVKTWLQDGLQLLWGQIVALWKKIFRIN